jgi:hypothetical protein
MSISTEELNALDQLGRDVIPHDKLGETMIVELLNRQLIARTSENPSRFAVTGKGMAYLATYGYPVDRATNHTRCRVRRDGSLQHLRGNPYADKRAD